MIVERIVPPSEVLPDEVDDGMPDDRRRRANLLRRGNEMLLLKFSMVVIRCRMWWLSTQIERIVRLEAKQISAIVRSI